MLYQEIQFHPSYCIDTAGFFSNNKVFLLPQPDNYLLAVLNSPLMWWYNWRYLPHMKDEALSPVAELMEKLPIALPTDAVRSQVEPAASRLIAITEEERSRQRDLLEWLRVEFEVGSAGQKLQALASLDEATFIDEVRRARPRTAARLTPAALRELRDAYDVEVPPIRHLSEERRSLETRLSDLVNASYGLTPEDVALMWSTAPPRMPRVDLAIEEAAAKVDA